MLYAMRIVGIDPGLATIGLGVLDARSPYDMQAVEWLTIKTKAGESASSRLAEIHADLTAFLRQTKPELAVVEKLFFATNEKTAMDVSQARGCILLALEQEHIPLMEATPLQLKSCITGDGKASKDQVRDMLVRMLSLTEIPTPDDAADALALAVFGALSIKTTMIA